MEAGFRPFAGFKLAISTYAATWGTGFRSYCALPYLIGSVADGMGLGIEQAHLGDHLHWRHPDLHREHSDLYHLLHIHLVVHLRACGRAGSPRMGNGRSLGRGQSRRRARTVHQRLADREQGLRGDGNDVVSTLSIVVALSIAVGWHINQKLKRASSNSASPSVG